DMSLEIHGVDESLGERLGGRCRDWIVKMESAFSLYRNDSELSRLNRERVLEKPSRLFLEMVEQATQLEGRTAGYFQPAIHGAWQWLVERNFSDTTAADKQWLNLCAAAKPCHLIRGADGSLRLDHPLTQWTFNAIAQGELADRVAGELRAAGVKSALLHLGETYAIGQHPSGRNWRLAVRGTGKEPSLVGEMELADAGLAVSANEPGRLLIDPVARALRCQQRVAAVVSSEGAAVADAFATALAIAPEEKLAALSRNLLTRSSGRIKVWQQNRLIHEA
ncbi:MAG TPA: FAD:protein FMN transferase, partial [Luteolibacter sp.]|nr:FAD:protein FMN transferase [Luteolibacter sp.]